MIRHVSQSEAKSFLIGTEVDLVTRLRRENPDKIIYPLLDEAICENMKLHTLEKVKNSLLKEEYLVTVSEEIISKARIAVERMLEIS
jgi:quinolinate synthase